jgi:hypothetical protein
MRLASEPSLHRPTILPSQVYSQVYCLPEQPMAQITLYLEDALQARLKASAERHQMSQSQFVAKLIRQAVDDQWPPEVLALAGSMADFPNADELRASNGTDVPRLT